MPLERDRRRRRPDADRQVAAAPAPRPRPRPATSAKAAGEERRLQQRSAPARRRRRSSAPRVSSAADLGRVAGAAAPAPPARWCPCAGSRTPSRARSGSPRRCPPRRSAPPAPSWPTTPVSTAPRIGTVAFDSTIGSAILSTRRWRDRASAISRRRRPASGNARWPGRTGGRGCPARPRHGPWHSAAPSGSPGPAHRRRAAGPSAGSRR